MTQAVAHDKGNGAKELGAVVTLSDEEVALVRASEAVVRKLQHQLGMHRMEYLQAEAQAFGTIQKAQQEFRAVVSALAGRHGIEIGAGRSELWDFDTTAMTFTRTR